MRGKNRTGKVKLLYPRKRKYLNFYEKVTDFLMESYLFSIRKWRSYKKRMIFFLAELNYFVACFFKYIKRQKNIV